MQYLLDETAGDPSLAILHVDSRFAASLADMQKFRFAKLLRIPRYCLAMLRHRLAGGIDAIVLTPTFHFRPFLKDAVFIWWCSLILRKPPDAWLHMDFRAMHYDSLPAPARWLARATLKRCRRFLVVSPRLKSYLPSWIDAARVDAIPNGIPAPLPPRQRPADAPVRVLYLSNLEQAKGWQILLEAARHVCRQHPTIEFIFHGRPAFGLIDDDIHRTIASDHADGRIRFAGPVYDDAKWQALADADIFAFPSFHEAFPLSILEAMAAGLPIVATDVGGVPDAFSHGDGGFIVPPQNADALADAILRLAGDPQRRLAMGSANRQRYLLDFTITAFGQRWKSWIAAHTD
jgi:glycosyltransferase involved in cell wall biosynthesis